MLDFDTFHNVINNELRTTSITRHGTDPSTGKSLPEVPVATKADVDEAVKHARKAFKPWARLTADERAVYVNKFSEALKAESESLQKWISIETGKPPSTAAVEMSIAIDLLNDFATMRLENEPVEDSDDRRVYVRYVPIGVGTALVPWNWPLVLSIGKVGPALMTGNTLIVKPSPFAPYVNLKCGEIASKIFPPGVLQYLSGGDDLGPMLTEHSDIDKVSFTGSTATGINVMKSAAGTIKRVTLELGGNDAAIVCEDADMAKTIPKIGAMAFLGSGQICMNVKRIYVHEKIYDQFRQGLVEFVNSLKTGSALDQDTFFGPVQNSMQYGKVKDMFAEITKSGWTAAVGGKVNETLGGGFFFEPTVIDNPPEKSRIVAEEPFGPIVPLLKWSDEEDVIARANDTKMGLGASVWTQDIKRGERIQDQLEAGSVWLNTHFELTPRAPFGGHKWSGLGMEWGTVGFKSWCNAQSVWWKKQM